MKNALPVLLLCSALLAACGTAPPSRLYTLGAESVASDRLTTVTESRRIELVSVRIPELWDRPQIVMTQTANEVGLSEFHRWASPLRAEVPRIVARDLRRLFDNPNIWLREDFAGAKPELRVQVMIERIEAIDGKGVQLDAAWTVRSVTGEAVTVGHSVISEPTAGTGHEAVVISLRRALSLMSVALAKDVAAMPKDGNVR